MRNLSVSTCKALHERDDTWVQRARDLTMNLKKEGKKERQLRLIQGMAETSESWEAVALFIRYQAARGELDKTWAEGAIGTLKALQADAKDLAGKDNPKAVHLELVARVLGYAVRWHVWDTKGEEKGS